MHRIVRLCAIYEYSSLSPPIIRSSHDFFDNEKETSFTCQREDQRLLREQKMTYRLITLDFRRRISMSHFTVRKVVDKHWPCRSDGERKMEYSHFDDKSFVDNVHASHSSTNRSSSPCGLLLDPSQNSLLENTHQYVLQYQMR